MHQSTGRGDFGLLLAIRALRCALMATIILVSNESSPDEHKRLSNAADSDLFNLFSFCSGINA